MPVTRLKQPDYVFEEASFIAPDAANVENAEIRLRLYGDSKVAGPRVLVEIALDDAALGYLYRVVKRAAVLRRIRLAAMRESIEEITQ